MALEITMQSGNKYTWHVGSGIPIRYDEICAIQEIQADGDELYHIVKQYRNGQWGGNDTYSIPVPAKNKVVRWFGDFAKTIAANL